MLAALRGLTPSAIISLHVSKGGDVGLGIKAMPTRRVPERAYAVALAPTAKCCRGHTQSMRGAPHRVPRLRLVRDSTCVQSPAPAAATVALVQATHRSSSRAAGGALLGVAKSRTRIPADAMVAGLNYRQLPSRVTESATESLVRRRQPNPLSARLSDTPLYCMRCR